MTRSDSQLLDDALRIWQAGVAAVQPARLIPEFVSVEGSELHVGDETLPLADVGRFVVVGGGKAAGAMAAALDALLPSDAQVDGWVNAPADAIVPTRRIYVHPARPPGANEPTAEALAGVREMLRLVGEAGPRDVCICLLSGGGSALLPAPIDGLSLDAKLTLTRELSARGAAIHQLNAVRRELSAIKGGGLARACRAGQMFALILSDVPGDDLATIASGPTVRAAPAPDEAIAVLESFGLANEPAGQAAIELLRRRRVLRPPPPCEVTNLLIGNNAAAVDAAGVAAEQLGYSHAMISARAPEGPVAEVAGRLVEMAVRMRDNGGPDCLISGGEPTVRLAPAGQRGLGGRNQQLCLEALALLQDRRGLALISGGTDGEDGPTDAAGAFVNVEIADRAAELGLNVAGALARNDAYHYFADCGGLLITGATHTNVCDLRVITVAR